MNKIILKLLTLSLTSLCLWLGCSAVQVNDYKNELPVFRLEEFFNGHLDAYGIVQNRSGKVIKRFHCTILANWQGAQGFLHETFEYSDGTKSNRNWVLTRHSDSNYTGKAEDVVGEALGEVSGNAFHWNYVLDVLSDGSHYNINFDDWMYLQDKNILINKTKMSKFGFDVGEVTLTIIKQKIN